MQRGPCPSEQDLLAFHLGTLSGEILEKVADHLEGCPSCEAAVDRLESSADPLLAALRGPRPSDPNGAGRETREVVYGVRRGGAPKGPR
jgi:hypothetical protein